MIFFRKYFFKIIISGAIIAFLILSPSFLFTKIYSLNYNLTNEYQLEFQGVLKLWHIDTFEGGSFSRSGFLESRAIEFEKQNKGVYISVENMTVSQLKLNLESGKTPNLISFGIGVGDLFYDKIINFNSSYIIRDDLISSGKLDGKIKALPIMLGGYSLISNRDLGEDEDIILGLKNSKSELLFADIDYINPLLALFVNDLQINKQEDKKITSFDAYDKFINEKANALLGTQRDFYRCKNRENNLKMSCNYNLLSGFSDLIQYISIFESDEKIEEEISNRFVEYLLSENVQEMLNKIGMFPVIDKIIYTDESYKKFNEILLKDLKTLNVFYSEDTLNDIKILTKQHTFGERDNKNEILKYLNG